MSCRLHPVFYAVSRFSSQATVAGVGGGERRVSSLLCTPTLSAVATQSSSWKVPWPTTNELRPTLSTAFKAHHAKHAGVETKSNAA